jgi:hypothetical protein
MHTSQQPFNRAINQQLWTVDDNFIDHPGEKFERTFSPLVEATVEQWGCFQFDSATLPDKLYGFVERFVKMLGIPNSKFSSVPDACNQVLHRVEYEEPYFFLVDTRIQLERGEALHTYRHRKTGDFLDPSRLEIFRLERGWDYKPYLTIKNMMEHPGMRAFLERNVMPPGFKDRDAAMLALLSKMSEVVWGPFGWLQNFVSEMLSNYEECYMYDSEVVPDAHAREEFSDAIQRDFPFWMACALGLMTWCKGPDALEFLMQYHIIYDQLLYMRDDGLIVPVPGTGDEVIVEGANVYTHLNLEKTENRRADTCVRCGVHTHCTKYMNLTALTHRTCSCGLPVNPMDTGDDIHKDHNYGRDCQEYFSQHPPRQGYICQRCLFATVNNMDPDMQCGRASCPAINCPHHQGAAMRLRALTQQRTRQLTASAKA